MRRLAGAVLADQREAVTGSQVKRHVAHGRLGRARVGERHVLEAHAVPGIGSARRVAAVGRHRRVEVLVERREVEVVLVHAADRREDRGDRRLALPEQQHVHRHLAERDLPAHRADRNPRVGGVERGRADEPEPESPGVAADRERAVLAEDLAEDRAIAREQQRPELEELDLLGVVLAGEHGLEVHLHARLGRAPAEQAERVARELGLGDERRQAGQQQHGDGPRRELRQQRAEAAERDRVLHETEAAHHERERPRRGLAPRARQLVVELRVLEVREIERQRLLEDHLVDALPELRAQQRLARRQPALRGRERRRRARLRARHSRSRARDRPRRRLSRRAP